MKYCDFNGCPNKINRGTYCEDHGRSSKARKRKSIYHNTNKSFYNSKEWKHVRSMVYERERGYCQRCRKFVFGKQAQVHHVVPVKKNPSLKLELNNLKLLCPVCHSIEENMVEKENVFASYFD
ncbi:HNH endonuclease [Metabacillus litoralis]|uniref:HNH endonuclease n=1 Tax=Metabacillus litoralis TaxID=152268 RepID=UPI00203DBE50|nr:HNH endonuclease [Metabacillus litoralis]MCM3411473.1 HNH endonuclease [Metabacillus litoralis]